MNLLRKWWNGVQRPVNTVLGLPGIDNLTKSVAVAVSSRGFLKQVLAGAATFGLVLFDVQPAAAVSCSYCAGSCTCSTSSVNCCSPNGQFCYFKSCTISGCAGVVGQI